MRMQDWHVGTSSCPWCNHKIDGALAVHKDGPSPGDFSLCIYCGEWNVLDDNLKLRKPTDDEFEDIGSSDKALLARLMWLATRKEKK